MNRNRRAPSYATILLLSHLFQEYNEHGIPPITLAAIAGQILVYFRTVPLFWSPRLSNTCLSANKILYRGEYEKLVISQIEHGDDWHLYYNMVSFLIKGKHLEGGMGTTKYFILLLVFIVMTGITYVGLNYGVSEIMEDPTYMTRCAVGFSGVIFSLKVLTTHDMSLEGREASVLGLNLGTSAKYSVWFELFYISMITPNASFIGHLAGILVGLAYVYGPLKYFVDFLHGSCFSII